MIWKGFEKTCFLVLYFWKIVQLFFGFPILCELYTLVPNGMTTIKQFFFIVSPEIFWNQVSSFCFSLLILIILVHLEEDDEIESYRCFNGPIIGRRRGRGCHRGSCAGSSGKNQFKCSSKVLRWSRQQQQQEGNNTPSSILKDPYQPQPSP